MRRLTHQMAGLKKRSASMSNWATLTRLSHRRHVGQFVGEDGAQQPRAAGPSASKPGRGWWATKCPRPPASRSGRTPPTLTRRARPIAEGQGRPQDFECLHRQSAMRCRRSRPAPASAKAARNEHQGRAQRPGGACPSGPRRARVDDKRPRPVAEDRWLRRSLGRGQDQLRSCGRLLSGQCLRACRM